MRTVGSDAVGDECKSKTCFRFTETTPGVVGKRSEPTNPAGPAKKKIENLLSVFIFTTNLR